MWRIWMWDHHGVLIRENEVSLETNATWIMAGWNLIIDTATIRVFQHPSTWLVIHIYQ